MTKKIFTVLVAMLIAVSLFASTDNNSTSTESYADFIPPGFIVVNSSSVSSMPFIVNVDSIAMVVPVKPFSNDSWKAKIFVSYGVGIGGSYYNEETSSFITAETYSEVVRMIYDAKNISNK